MAHRWRRLWAASAPLWAIYVIPTVVALVTTLAAEWLLGRAGW
jgi:hypothetical protein